MSMAVLVTSVATAQDVQRLDTAWRGVVATHPLVVKFRETGRFAQLHVDVFDGQFLPTVWDDGGIPLVALLQPGAPPKPTDDGPSRVRRRPRASGHVPPSRPPFPGVRLF